MCMQQERWDQKGADFIVICHGVTDKRFNLKNRVRRLGSVECWVFVISQHHRVSEPSEKQRKKNNDKK